MYVVTGKEMQKLDHAAINDYGIPSLVLMENAGRQVVEVVAQVLGSVKGKSIIIIAGKGNNGGDGLVVARHLLNMGAEVKVFLCARPEEISGDAKVNLFIWQKMGQKVHLVRQMVHQNNEINLVRLALMNADLIVDALYGTGFKGAVSEEIGKIIKVINDSRKPVIAVDIPSGLEADTGKVNGPCIQASYTVTFALPKVGLVIEPGASFTGKLQVVDISIPWIAVETAGLKRNLLTGELVRKWLPPRSADVHKGDFGRVLVIAGSRGLTGAACLASEAAVRAGAGLVTLGVPESLHDLMEVKLTEVMTVPLPDTGEGAISQIAYQKILTLLERAEVLAIGPGLSTGSGVVALIQELLPAIKIPCVLDADALNALVGKVELLKEIKAPAVITPHPGEMARLLGISSEEVQQERLQVVIKAAAEWQVTVLLKGARTIIASSDGLVYINPTGNPGMATGGTGDVLTGIIAALIAQGLNTNQAAAAGAYIHGLAGDLAAREKGFMGLIAGDVLSTLPTVLKDLMEKESREL